MAVTKHLNGKLSAKAGIAALKKLFKEDIGLVYTTIGGLGASVLGALFWLILASILSVADYGLANYYIALASLFAGIGTVGLNITITTFIAKGERNILFEANSLVLISGFITALALTIFQWEAGITSIVMVFFTMALAEMLGKKAYKEYALVSIGQKIAQIALSMLLYFQLGIMGIVLGYFLGALIFSYRYLFSLKKLTNQFANLKEKRNFAFHTFGFNLIGMTLPMYLDKIIIGGVFGYYTLGLYQLGFQFFMFLGLIPMSLQQYLLAEESSGNKRRQIKTVALILTATISIALILLTPYLIENFFPTFTEAIPLIALMIIAVIPSTVASILLAGCLGNENSKAVFISGALYLGILVVGLMALGALLGIIGLGLAVLLAKAAQASYLFFNR